MPSRGIAIFIYPRMTGIVSNSKLLTALSQTIPLLHIPNTNDLNPGSAIVF